MSLYYTPPVYIEGGVKSPYVNSEGEVRKIQLDPDSGYFAGTLGFAKKEFTDKPVVSVAVACDYFKRSQRGEVGELHVPGVLVKGVDSVTLSGGSKSIDSLFGDLKGLSIGNVSFGGSIASLFGKSVYNAGAVFQKPVGGTVEKEKVKGISKDDLYGSILALKY